MFLSLRDPIAPRQAATFKRWSDLAESNRKAIRDEQGFLLLRLLNKRIGVIALLVAAIVVAWIFIPFDNEPTVSAPSPVPETAAIDTGLASARRIAATLRIGLSRSSVEAQFKVPTFEKAVTNFDGSGTSLIRVYYRFPIMDLVIVYDDQELVAYGITSFVQSFTPCAPGTEVCVGSRFASQDWVEPFSFSRPAGSDAPMVYAERFVPSGGAEGYLALLLFYSSWGREFGGEEDCAFGYAGSTAGFLMPPRDSADRALFARLRKTCKANGIGVSSVEEHESELIDLWSTEPNPYDERLPQDSTRSDSTS
jgi:hypothetical protein